MAGETSFTFTEADLIVAGRERLCRWLFQPKSILIHLSALGAMFGLGYAFMEPCNCVGTGAHARDGLILAWAIAAWLFLYYAVYYFATIGWSVRKTLRDHAAMRAPFTIAWTDEALVHGSLHGTTTYRWEDLAHWGRSASAFLIYYGKRLSFIVPCRALTDKQVNDLDMTLQTVGLPRR